MSDQEADPAHPVDPGLDADRLIVRARGVIAQMGLDDREPQRALALEGGIRKPASRISSVRPTSNQER